MADNLLKGSIKIDGQQGVISAFNSVSAGASKLQSDLQKLSNTGLSPLAGAFRQQVEAQNVFANSLRSIPSAVADIPAAVKPASAAVEKLQESLISLSGAKDSGVSALGSELGVVLPAADEAAAAIDRLNAHIDAIGEKAKVSSVQLVNLGSGRIPLGSITAYNSAITKLKANLGSVKISALAQTIPPSLPTQLRSATTALKQVPNASNQATQSLVNLSRVAQDAPFGFLGIANNLNPLLESFQRLKATTGTTGGALKALGRSLMGAGGVGLALGVTSSLLVVFGDKLFGASEATKKAGEAAKEAAEQLKSLIKPIEDISDAASSVEGEISKVKALTGVILDQTKSYNERNNALNQLKAINKNYFGDLTLEQKSLEKLTGLVNEYTKALVAAAVVKGFESEIGKVAVELSKQDRALAKSAEELKKYKTLVENTELGDLNQKTGQFSNAKAVKEAAQGLEDSRKAFKDQAVTVVKLKNQYGELENAINKAVQETLKFKPLETPTETTTKAKVKVEPKFEFTPVKGATFTDELKKIALGNNASFKIPVNTVIEPQVQIGQAQKDLKKVLDFFQVQIGGTQRELKLQLDIKPVLNPVTEEIRIQAEAAAATLAQSLQQAIQQALVGIFAGLGDAIGAALSGNVDGIQNGFKAIISIMGTLITKIGEALIQYGIVKSGLDKILAGGIAIPGVAAIAAGVAAVAIGSLIKNSQIQGFARGGVVPPGFPGDGFPAMLSSGEKIIPAGQPYGGGERLITTISGTQLRVLLQRTDKSLGRTA